MRAPSATWVRLCVASAYFVVCAGSGDAQTASGSYTTWLLSGQSQTNTPEAPNSTTPATVPAQQQQAGQEARFVLPPRVGIVSETSITLQEVIEQVLANNKTVAITRVDVEQAGFNVKAALGAFDPILGGQVTYQHQVTATSSFLSGSTTGSVIEKTLNFVPQLS